MLYIFLGKSAQFVLLSSVYLPRSSFMSSLHPSIPPTASLRLCALPGGNE